MFKKKKAYAKINKKKTLEESKHYAGSKRKHKTTATTTTTDILWDLREGFMPTEQEQGDFLKKTEI